MAGYSGTPLHRKLGIKADQRAYVRNAPDDYFDWLADLEEHPRWFRRWANDLDFVHLFVTARRLLELDVTTAQERLSPNGMIWVSWPKKSSGVATEVTEDVIREVCLPLGLVDVKVCAVDAVWSGLKLVIRKELR